MLKNVIERMELKHKKLIFFQTIKKLKQFILSGETADQLGTFMMLEGAKEPYVVYIQDLMDI